MTSRKLPVIAGGEIIGYLADTRHPIQNIFLPEEMPLSFLSDGPVTCSVTRSYLTLTRGRYFFPIGKRHQPSVIAWRAPDMLTVRERQALDKALKSNLTLS